MFSCVYALVDTCSVVLTRLQHFYIIVYAAVLLALYMYNKQIRKLHV